MKKIASAMLSLIISGLLFLTVHAESDKSDMTYQLPDITVSLKQEKGKHYSTAVNLEISLSYNEKNKNVRAEIHEKKNQIVKTITKIMSDKYYDDVDSSFDRMMLKVQIVKAINKMFTTGQIQTLHFKEFLFSKAR